jgi:NTP pyrophosphatase (non-canonical NTP hydrolase)
MAELNEIQKAVHGLAKEKGWHDVETTLTEKIMLVVTELSEAVESIRRNESPIWQKGKVNSPLTLDQSPIKLMPSSPDWDSNIKPEGVLVELADSVIRVMDICESQGWDLERAIKIKHSYNKTRSYRHGGKIL